MKKILNYTILLWISLMGPVWAEEDRKIIAPPPDEIRKYEPQPNRLMKVTYANDRVFLYRITKIIAKPHCNHISYDTEKRRIRITTQAISQAYEYVLESEPIMVSDWIPYGD